MTRLLAFSLLIIIACEGKKPSINFDSLTEEQQHLPEFAEASLEVSHGLKATLFASEPMVINPTDMDIDEKGRVWVCEGYNYRPDLNAGNVRDPEGDKILILEDTDKDGKADKRSVYYQGNDVNAALGICVLGNKVIVSCSPNVLIFTDLDGDDKPDKKEVFFTGIGGEQHDHAMHAFVFGPDGKLYFNFGNAGDQINDKNGNPITDKYNIVVNGSGNPYMQGMVFRCNMDGSDFEVLGHNFRNNYEVTVDSYGTIWQSDNDDDGNKGVRINYVMEHGNFGYKDEFTGASWKTSRTGMSDSIPIRHWHQNDPGVVPNLLQTGAGSPTGILIYEGDLLPEVFQNQIIHSDAGPNVVRAYPTKKDGAGYQATIENIVNGKSQWFRPSDVTTAPDGSLFIADWYDPGVGGHQMRDQQKGRIYRVAPEDKAYELPTYNVETIAGAIEALQSPNLSARYLGWQKLHEAGDEAEVALRQLWQSGNSVIQARALWLLASLEVKGAAYISEAIKSNNSDLRITGLRAARLKNQDMGTILNELSKDTSPQVRREVAIALKDYQGEDAARLWTMLAIQYSDDRWYLEALGIAADGRWNAFLNDYLTNCPESVSTASKYDIIWRSRADQTASLLADIIIQNQDDFNTGLRYYRSFDFLKDERKNDQLLKIANAKTAFPDQNALYVLKQLDSEQSKGNAEVKGLVNRVLNNVEGTQEFVDLVKKYGVTSKDKELLQLVLDKPAESAGIDAAALLLDWKKGTLLLSKLSKGSEKEGQAVITAVGNLNSPEANEMKITAVQDLSLSLNIRKTALQLMGRGWRGEDQLMSLVKSGQIPEDLSSVASGVLFSAYRKAIRDTAALYFQMPDVRGGESLPPINELIALEGNMANGKLVFEKYCQVCHQVNGAGTGFGPALSEIGSKYPKNGLYVSILQPDAGISFGYEGFTFELKDGSMLVGIIESETETQVDILQIGGIKSTVETSNIVLKKQLERSLMPSDLQKGMTTSELVDLVEYLSALKKEAS